MNHPDDQVLMVRGRLPCAHDVGAHSEGGGRGSGPRRRQGEPHDCGLGAHQRALTGLCPQPTDATKSRLESWSLSLSRDAAGMNVPGNSRMHCSSHLFFLSRDWKASICAQTSVNSFMSRYRLSGFFEMSCVVLPTNSSRPQRAPGQRWRVAGRAWTTLGARKAGGSGCTHTRHDLIAGSGRTSV